MNRLNDGMKDYRDKVKVIRNPTVEYVDIHIIIDDEQLFLNEIKGSWAGRVYQSSCVLFEVLADEDDHITFRSVHLNPEFGNKLLLSNNRRVKKKEFKKYPEKFYYTRIR